MKRYITLTRKCIDTYKDKNGVEREDGYHYEEMDICPDNILFFSQQDADGYYSPPRHYCTRLYLLNGIEVFVREDKKEVKRMIERYYREKEKDNANKITISKDDIVKNFIFKNLG